MGNYRPTETVDPKMPLPPKCILPPGSCDTHCHVFGPYDQFPFVVPSSYPPPLAPFELYKKMLDTVGLERGVLVQTAPYGTDPSALVDALSRGNGQIKGIAVATSSASDDELERLKKAGVVGLRFNEMADPTTGLPYKGSVGVEHLKALASRMVQLDWHAQIWGVTATCVRLAKELESLGIPIVFEHMSAFNVEDGVSNPAFQDFLALLSEGQIWLKLSLCRVSKQFPAYADARKFHDALVEANPDRLVWASDWPHVRLADKSPDVGFLVDLLYDWVNDLDVFKKIMSDNPGRLYGFNSS